jgi:predicted exporter
VTANVRLTIVVSLCLLLAAIAWPRLHLSYDLSAFLPAPSTPSQAILTDRLGQGVGAQLIFLHLQQSSHAQALDLANTLRGIDGVDRVLPEQPGYAITSLPQTLWHHRLLLQDMPSDMATWLDIFESRMDDLSFAGDNDLLDLIAGDPGFFSLNTIEKFTAAVSQPRFDQGEDQFLIIQTTPPAYDIAGQAAVITNIRAVLPERHAQLLGSPVYAVDLQSNVQFEATLFSLLASVLLIMLMVYQFRSAYQVISIALPLVAGGLAGLVALTFTFSQIHGITVAFGFTLLGVAIDYPLHLFTHSNHQAQYAEAHKLQPVWPTLRLGILSTLIAYGAFLFSGTSGLQQLGVFALAGIISAAGAAAFLCPQPSQVQQHTAAISSAPHLRFAPSLIALVSAGGILSFIPIFNDDLASLTPVDPELLAADANLRNQLGVTDIRYLVAVQGESLQACLEATEKTTHVLDRLTAEHQLGGYQAITQVLPSQRTQTARRTELANPPTQAAFSEALSQSDFRINAFAPFTADWQNTTTDQRTLTLEQLQRETAISGSVDNLLIQNQQGWLSLIFLQGINDTHAVTQSLATIPSATWLDLKSTSESLVSAYRGKLIKVLGLALAAISALLALVFGLRKVLWLLSTVGAAVMVAAAISTLVQSGLSLFDLMALTLVAGLGLDYALFYGRKHSGADERSTTQAVSICASSSLVVFGVLSFSSIPVLSGIGATVAIGVLSAYLLARFGAQQNAGR